jgi:uncharacterized membrane protein
MDTIVEAIAHACCHGIDARSLCIGGRALPFCARCTGMYVGVAVVVSALAVLGRLRDHRLPDLRNIALLGIPWAASGAARVLELAGWDIAGNPGRALLGFACGATGVLIFAPLFARVLWPQGSEPPCHGDGLVAGRGSIAQACGTTCPEPAEGAALGGGARRGRFDTLRVNAWPTGPRVGSPRTRLGRVVGAAMLLSPAALLCAGVRHAYLELAPAAGFLLVVAALNALVGASVASRRERSLRAAWALVVCAGAAEVALASVVQRWLSGLV